DELKDSVGGQMIAVTLASAADRPRALQVMATLECGEPQPSEAEREITMPALEAGVVLVEHVAHALGGAEIPVADLALRRPTLDDVFLTLTGAPAEDQAADGAAAAVESAAKKETAGRS